MSSSWPVRKENTTAWRESVAVVHRLSDDATDDTKCALVLVAR